MEGWAYIAPLKKTRETPILPLHESCRFQIIGSGKIIINRSEKMFNALKTRFAVLKSTQ